MIKIEREKCILVTEVNTSQKCMPDKWNYHEIINENYLTIIH